MASYEPPPPKRLGEFLESAVPPPPLPWWCANCEADVYDLIQSGGPRGLQWKCKRCLLAVHEPVHVFDPTRAPEGREESLLALATLTELVYGLRRADAEDLYAIVGPYFRAGWCVYDVHQALNGQPGGKPHPDNGWSDDLPYGWMLHRVKTRLRTWRFTDGARDGDILPGPYWEPRLIAQRHAERDREHAKARDAIWAEQAQAARRAPDQVREAARVARIQGRLRSLAGDRREHQQIMEQAHRTQDSS